MPQIGEYLATDASDMTNAIASIPAYIERSSHFFAIVPTVRHHDVHGVTCDYGSWLERGWCRLEMWALLLARFSNLPVIVVKGGEATPFMNACQAALGRPPGLGRFTCCAQGHRMPDKDGVMQCIPCDKDAISTVIWDMLKAKLPKGEFHVHFSPPCQELSVARGSNRK